MTTISRSLLFAIAVLIVGATFAPASADAQYRRHHRRHHSHYHRHHR